jgi:hypothetical protein
VATSSCGWGLATPGPIRLFVLALALGAAILIASLAAACGSDGEADGSSDVTARRESTYRFEIAYPTGFEFRAQPADKLANLRPRPEAAFLIGKTTSAPDDLEPPDLDVRVYGVERGASLRTWLESNGLLPAGRSDLAKPFETSHVSGLEVCAATMLAPGCSYFVLGHGWIYQLTPATVQGERIVDSFRVRPSE